MRRTPGTIRRAEPLGDDALTAKLARVLEYDVAVTLVVLVEHNAGMRATQQPGEFCLAPLDGQTAQVLAVKLD